MPVADSTQSGICAACANYREGRFLERGETSVFSVCTVRAIDGLLRERAGGGPELPLVVECSAFMSGEPPEPAPGLNAGDAPGAPEPLDPASERVRQRLLTLLDGIVEDEPEVEESPRDVDQGPLP